ncbi:class E sortase [Streptomyces sp. NPDC005271]|uniref:class E sortase n=1 Tax=unclassified Streptomyces TaxID=2593676 RepID=UPI0033B46F55
MTALRPEREGAAYGARESAPGAREPAPYASYEPHEPYEAGRGPDAFGAAVPGAGDSLNDPRQGSAPDDAATGHGVGTASFPLPPATGRRRRGSPAPSAPGSAGEPAGPPTGRRRARAASSAPPAPATPSGPRSAAEAAETAVLRPVAPRGDDETVALRAVGPQAASPGGDQTVMLRKVAPDAAPGPTPPPGGRAARRKAAQGGGKRAGRHGARAGGGAPEAGTAAAGTGRPRTRMEAKRAARARKDSPGVVASRLFGELFITLGVVMLLFVAYQLWWTNIRAHQQADGAASDLQKNWDRDGEEDRDPGKFSPGQGFAIIYIPKLDVKAPIAEGIDKHKVLDRGMVGHYGKGKLKTAMPWNKQGNFALAGHRNTHGEPFRYVNSLKPGDKIIVETQRRYYTYEMRSILPQTPPSNTSVIRPVPPGSGFTKPGRYITLTTCTPEFTSTYRMIVWGKMVDERPRSEGKPDALVE